MENASAALVEARQKMEREILRAVDVATKRFQADTGLTPRSISVHMTEASIVGGKVRDYLPCGVTCEVVI